MLICLCPVAMSLHWPWDIWVTQMVVSKRLQRDETCLLAALPVPVQVRRFSRTEGLMAQLGEVCTEMGEDYRAAAAEVHSSLRHVRWALTSPFECSPPCVHACTHGKHVCILVSACGCVVTIMEWDAHGARPVRSLSKQQ